MKDKTLVNMQDGTVTAFSNRIYIIVDADTDTDMITFKLKDGTVINWPVPDASNLNGFQKRAYMYGLLSKVKAALAPYPKNKYKEVIQRKIKELYKGEFKAKIFGDSMSVIKLTDIQKAYAIAKSKQDPSFIHWSNVDNAEVISEVLSDWNNKSRSEKNAVRKNPYVQLELAGLNVTTHPEASKVLKNENEN